jgi:Mrp family chromosome partitioning ATPase
MVIDNWDRARTGELRLGLVVASPHSGVHELAELVNIARTQPDNEHFRSATTARRARLRARLELLDAAVIEAAPPSCAIAPLELTWRLLQALHPIDVALEGDDAADRLAVVARLRGITNGEGTQANGLFAQLCELASKYASWGAAVDAPMLRRDLSGRVTLNRSTSHANAWEILARLNDQLQQRTVRQLTSPRGDVGLHLERTEISKALVAAMTVAGSSGRVLVVSGQPDVGKSALAISAGEALAAAGQEVLPLSLRDLPPSVLETERILGLPLREFFGSSAVSPVRLVLLDGAEAALENRFELLTEIGRSTRAAGLGLVAITRSDARGRIVEALTSRESAAPSVLEIEIEGLNSTEIVEVVNAFPALARALDEPRSSWLLKRLGLIDLLIRSEAFTALPDGALSEADIFNAVWLRLVRQSEQLHPMGSTPDGREAALIALARRQLLNGASVPSIADPTALLSLRSDGLLLALGPTAAWSSGDQFASDLIRDFALARLFVQSGFKLINDAGSPRWIIRAARLACQARLAYSGSAVEATRSEIQAAFDELAVEQGDRWADLPLEAIITFGRSREALELAWPALLANDGSQLRRLCRLVLQRHGDQYAISDPILIEPVVQLLYDHDVDIDQIKASRDVRGSIDKIELQWLRGLALRGVNDTPNSLRQGLRDWVLSTDLTPHDEDEQEFIALLGPDLDSAAVQCLRNLASETPWWLAPTVESVAAGLSLATHHPMLLLELSEAYYIDTRDDLHGGYSPMNDGIRRHHRKGGMRLASWWYGPFWALLRRAPLETLSFINRMLDHAVRSRIRGLRELGSASAAKGGDSNDSDMPGLVLSLFDFGSRKYVGDVQAWEWYRGSSVGPYPCMSALLAVERFIDQVYRVPKQLQLLSTRLLQDSHNLAMPGVVVGFLLRHLEDVTDELDPWLSEPEVWELEFKRASSQGRLHVQGPDEDDVPGKGSRNMSLREAAIALALRALAAHDDAAAARLRSVADRLVAQAHERYGPDTSSARFEERMAAVGGWASFLQSDSYESLSLPEGRSGFQYTPPPVAAEFIEQQADFDRGLQIMGLLKYGSARSRESEHIDELKEDLRIAKQLSGEPPKQGQQFAHDAFPAVAATAIIATSEGRFKAPREELIWSIGIILGSAARTSPSDDFDPGLFSMGGDRSAAQAMPCLLLPLICEEGELLLDKDDRQVIEASLLRVMTSGSEEVRRYAAQALRRVWSSPCATWDSGLCRHQLAFEAVETSTRDCRIRPFDDVSLRTIRIAIEGDIGEALDATAGKDLLVGRLTAPIIATSQCAMTNCCVSEASTSLRDALLRAHARAAVYWVGENFQLDHDPEVGRCIAESILESVDAGTVGILIEYAEGLMPEPLAFSQFLDEVARVATYEPNLRKTIRWIWPSFMDYVVAKLESNPRTLTGERRRGLEDRDEAVAALLLRPLAKLDDSDWESTWGQVREDWLDLESMESALARWLYVAAGIPKCVDSMVGFVDTLPLDTQTARGLDLVLAVVNGRFDRVASHTWLLCGWLERLKSKCYLDGAALSQFHVLVDGLVAHGDTRAVPLQRSLE